MKNKPSETVRCQVRFNSNNSKYCKVICDNENEKDENYDQKCAFFVSFEGYYQYYCQYFNKGLNGLERCEECIEEFGE
jgi:hypothetical protein